MFLHEINPTNPLFRFYMGYMFPSLNCIDEGVERWRLPRQLADYWLERSGWRQYSAHYMAVLRKAG